MICISFPCNSFNVRMYNYAASPSAFCPLGLLLPCCVKLVSLTRWKLYEWVSERQLGGCSLSFWSKKVWP